MAVRYATEFGMVGDGTTDDTTAFQSAIDALALGDALLLVPGATYSVTNLTIPSLTTAAYATTSIIGPATIKARSGGSSQYLVATRTWVQNSESSAGPWHWDAITFDADSIKDWAYVDRNYGSEHMRCQFLNPLVDGVLLTRTAQDGVTEGVRTLSRTYFQQCQFTAGPSTSGSLLKATGIAYGPADEWVVDCHFDGGLVAAHCMDIASFGGWVVRGNHTWNATDRDVLIRNLGRNGTFEGNVIEDGMRIGITSKGVGTQIGPGNRIWRDLEVDFDADDLSERLNIVGNHFQYKGPTDTPTDLIETEYARIVHTSTRPNKILVSLGNTFRAEGPQIIEDHPIEGSQRVFQAFDVIGWPSDWALAEVSWPIVTAANLTVGGGGTLRVNDDGNLLVNGGYSEFSREGNAYVGKFQSDTADPFWSLVNTVAAAGANIFGLRAGNGSLDFARLIAYLSDATSGSEDSEWRLQTRIAGVLTQIMTIGEGVQIGFPTGAFKGAGTINTSAGVYRENVPGMFTTGTKTTAAAPYTNDGYITVTLADGSTVKVMTTA